MSASRTITTHVCLATFLIAAVWGGISLIDRISGVSCGFPSSVSEDVAIFAALQLIKPWEPDIDDTPDGALRKIDAGRAHFANYQPEWMRCQIMWLFYYERHDAANNDKRLQNLREGESLARTMPK